jgi:hypothetical protein
VVEQMRARIEAGLPLGRFPFGPPSGEDQGLSMEKYNQIPLHPRLLQCARELLETEDIRLAQAGMMHKVGEAAGVGGRDGEQPGWPSGEQGLHQDYSNNTLVVPPRPPQRPETMNCILYFADASCGGATGIAPFSALAGEDMPRGKDDAPLIPRTYSVVDDWAIRRSNTHPLYAREQAVDYRPGTALLYRMDTFHRGTPVRPGASRITGHIVIKDARAEWLGSHSFIQPLSAMPPQFIAQLSVQQRRALAMPPPGHPFWDSERVVSVICVTCVDYSCRFRLYITPVLVQRF